MVRLDLGTETVVREAYAQSGADAIAVAFNNLLLERRRALEPITAGVLRAEAVPA